MELTFKNFNLQHTLESGQFFRYEKIKDWYFCHERDTLFKIKQIGDKLEFEGTTENHIKKLFGLNIEYEKLIKELWKDKTLRPAIEKYKGLRIMQRDPYETLVSFQCSIMSNIKKIKLNLDNLAKEFGKPATLDGFESFTFPKPGQLKDEPKIRNCKTGFRAKYIHQADKMVDDTYFQNVTKLSYPEAHEKLMELPGVAEKVSDCICLFALGKMNAFPVDVWIERLMKEQYPQTKNMKNKEIKAFALKKWGENAGYAQQFLYHWGRNK